MGKIICPGCREELDLVVLGYGTRSWDEKSQSYIHTEADVEGDWACPKCGAAVSETRFYPPTEAHYWQVTNMATGAVIPTITPSRSIAEAVSQAEHTMDAQYAHFEGDHLVIKIFSKSPDERYGVTYEPEYTESYWVSGAPKSALEALERISQPLTLDRPVPQTYGDWVDLGISIKEKAGIDDYETTALVNKELNHIYEEEQDPKIAQEAKRTLTRLAGMFGVK